MSEVRNASISAARNITFAAVMLHSARVGSATAVVIIAIGWVLVELLSVTLPYIREAAPAFPEWWSKLLKARWEGVLQRFNKQHLAEILPPHGEGAGPGVASGQMSLEDELRGRAAV